MASECLWKIMNTEPNPFVLFTFTPNYVTGHVLQWVIDYGFMDPMPFDFTLQLAEVPTFTGLIWSSNVGDHFYAVDNSNSKTTAESFYYRVKLVTPKDVYYSPSIVFGNGRTDKDKYLKAAEISRKELLRMRVYTGHEAYLLKRKTYGVMRGPTVDVVTGEPIANQAPDYGTGIQDGYHKPIKFMYSYEGCKHTKGFNDQGFGVVSTDVITYRMVGFPLVSPKDIIVDLDDGVRYSIETFDHTIYPGSNIHLLQRGTMLAVPPTDPIYQLQTS